MHTKFVCACVGDLSVWRPMAKKNWCRYNKFFFTNIHVFVRVCDGGTSKKKWWYVFRNRIWMNEYIDAIGLYFSIFFLLFDHWHYIEEKCCVCVCVFVCVCFFYCFNYTINIDDDDDDQLRNHNRHHFVVWIIWMWTQCYFSMK